MLKINEYLAIPLREFQFTFVRSSGPGGQNVNKVNTKACLKWDVAANSSLPEPVKNRIREKCRRRINQEGEFVLTSQRFRDQGRNVADCIEKLRDILIGALHEPKKRKATKPTKGSQRRRLEQKKARSQVKRQRGTNWD